MFYKNTSELLPLPDHSCDYTDGILKVTDPSTVSDSLFFTLIGAGYYAAKTKGGVIISPNWFFTINELLRKVAAGTFFLLASA